MNDRCQPTREDWLSYVCFVVDDVGSGRILKEDPYAIVREAGVPCFGYPEGPKYSSVLVGWQCGFEPLFIAVHSYLDVELSDEEAAALAMDYLEERKWFSREPTEPDYIIRGTGEEG